MDEANHTYLDEARAVALVAELVGPPPAGLLIGIGDDCAVLARPERPLAVTADAMVEGVHFRRDLMSPRQIGRRVMAANLSDLAAMGAAPRFGFLTLGLAPPVARDFLEPLLRGLIESGLAHGLHLAGGDMVRSPNLFINLTLMGETESGPLLRSTARDGDLLCVTGCLGGAAAGLAWLMAGRPEQEAPRAVAAYRDPVPRVAAGAALANSGLVSAMMDLSDGLAPDLSRLAAASGLGAALDGPALPIAEETHAAARALGLDPKDLALNGGEDFELLLACDPQVLAEIKKILADLPEGGLTITPVGRMVEGEGVVIQGPEGDIPLAPGGFDHFGG